MPGIRERRAPRVSRGALRLCGGDEGGQAAPGCYHGLMPQQPANLDQLKDIAHQAMLDNGLEPDLPPAAAEQLRTIKQAAMAQGVDIRDLRERLWCSIDNDDSRDLDQLSVAEPLAGGNVKILVAVADVDATVPAGSALDAHASANTTSVYTPAEIFPMLPEQLSTDITCLALNQDRLSFVVEMTVSADGALSGESVYRAVVRNRAKLAYNSVAAWLDGKGPMPAPIAAVPGMEQQIRVKDGVRQKQ